MHAYSPDFIIRRNNGKVLIVEIKNAQFKAVTNEDLNRNKRGEQAISVEGRKAVAAKRWEILNPDTLKYEIYFVKQSLGYDEISSARQFSEEIE